MSRSSKPDFESNTLNAYLVRPEEIQNGDRYGYKVVLVVWADHSSFCCFRGGTARADNVVALYGDQVPEEVARLLFPVVYHELVSEGFFYENV